MPEIEKTYERILKYLKGALTPRQRHELEKEMMQDAFDEEAFEGLSQLPADVLASDMDRMMNRLDNRIQQGKTRNIRLYLRIAAAIVFIVGLAGTLYIFLRSPEPKLITQESGMAMEKSHKTPPAPVESPMSESATEAADAGKSGISKSRVPAVEDEVMPGVTDETNQVTVMQEEPAVEDLRKIEVAPAPAVAATRSAEPLVQPAGYDEQAGKYITGKIVGIDGIGLAGVSILEKGSQHGVISDIDGNFSIELRDAGSELLLSSVGFKSLEVTPREIADKPITMQEDLMALEEVVVVGYAASKKNKDTGAVSRLESRDIGPGGITETYSLVYPVPPGGTLRAFKNWVNERIDTTGFKAFPGKHRLQAILSVQENGTLYNIRMRSTAPRPIVEAYRTAISLSPSWIPALKDDLPVEAEVVIRFVITVEE